MSTEIMKFIANAAPIPFVSGGLMALNADSPTTLGIAAGLELTGAFMANRSLTDNPKYLDRAVDFMSNDNPTPSMAEKVIGKVGASTGTAGLIFVAAQLLESTNKATVIVAGLASAGVAYWAAAKSNRRNQQV